MVDLKEDVMMWSNITRDPEWMGTAMFGDWRSVIKDAVRVNK